MGSNGKEVGGLARGYPHLIVDGLNMPTLDRRWFEEWKAGHVGCVNVTVSVWDNAHETFSLLSKWRRLLRENSDLVESATTVDDIRRIAASGRTAIVFGFQNTAPIEHDIELFGAFRELGVCIMQLTYNLQNYIGSGYWEKNDSGISSRFGQAAIKEMNQVGIMIDLSHCGERTTLDAIELSEKPVAITHANPREYVGDPVYGSGRLKTTEAIVRLAERGGVIGLTPNRNMTRNGAKTTLSEFCDMVLWTIDKIGINAVGLGTDYCPGHPRTVRTWWRFARWSRESAPSEQMQIAPHEGWPDWIRSPEGIQNIAEGLSSAGLDDADIKKIMGENWMRMFGECFSPQR